MGGTTSRFYGGNTAVMKGGIELVGVPQVPPLGKTLSSDNALSFSDSEDETVDTIQSSINSCPNNHLLKNSSDKVQLHPQKVQGTQKSKSALLPRPNDVVSYIPVGEETWHKAVIISKAG